MEDEEIDRISELPDSILSKILSHLPTKYAVSVSILSTRWKNISPFVVPPITLDFDEYLRLHPRKKKSKSSSSSFMKFVDKLLNETLSDVPYVENMILQCKNHYGDAKMVSWVRAVIRLRVQKLNLEFFLYDSNILFRSLKGCTTLVELTLLLVAQLFLPDNFTLPNLKSLELACVTFNDEDGDSISELIEGCPVLECLILKQCDLQGLENLVIECPLLKTLFIEDCFDDSSCELILDAPNLEKFMLQDCVAGVYSVSLSKSLHLVYIHAGLTPTQLYELEECGDDESLWYYDDVPMLVSSCASTSRLYLSAFVIHCLHRSSLELPMFQNLTWLSLDCLGLHCAILATLLWNAPHLERLTMEGGFEKNEGEFAKFNNLLSVPPKCLELHMKKIEIWAFKGREDEIELVEYFLKNGKVLQKLIIHCLSHDDTSISSRLLMLPRQSKTCQIVFEEKLE